MAFAICQVVYLNSNHLCQRKVQNDLVSLESNVSCVAIHWVVDPGKFLTKTLHSGFCFFANSHPFVCLIILSPNIMTDSLLDLGF